MGEFDGDGFLAAELQVPLKDSHHLIMPVIAEGEPGEFRNQVVAISEANDSAAAHARVRHVADDAAIPADFVPDVVVFATKPQVMNDVVPAP